MKFEEFTLETANSIHRYLVNGECSLSYDMKDELISIHITLELPILFVGTAYVVEINDVMFECDTINVMGTVIDGYVKTIGSQVYSRKLSTNN